MPPTTTIHPPDFFLIGAPKAGTTAMSRYLGEHPRIHVSSPKEPFYFCDDFPAMPGPKTESEYLELFRCDPEAISHTGEATAIYLYSERAVPRILEFNPEARILVMLRRPIELAVSWHAQQLYGLSEDVADFETAWRLQETRRKGEDLPPLVREPKLLLYREVAMLGRQMERLYSVAPRERVHVTFFDDFVRDAATEYRKVLRFLGVPDDGRDSFPVVNERKGNRNALLARLINRPPKSVSRLVSRMKRRLGFERVGLLDGLRRANASAAEKPTLPEALREEMRESFREDVERLARLLDRDLSDWLD